jgi:hypothetical protein
MFKQLSPSVIEKMKKDGRIILTIKSGWERVTTMSAAPYKINLYIGRQMEHLFNCYLQMYGSTVVVSNIEPSLQATTQKGILDGYLYLAIDGLIKFAKTHDKKRMIVDTTIKCAADHLPHYGFKLFSETDYPTNSIKGILLLK